VEKKGINKCFGWGEKNKNKKKTEINAGAEKM